MNPEDSASGQQSLLVEQLDIQRLDGISGAFSLDEFASGINLIIGPNASGKSRTASVLQGLIWPKLAPDRAEFSGRLATRDETWIVNVFNRDARHLRDGSPVDRPSLSGIPADQSDRYLLTLHDLLRADNRCLAEQIQRESAGGYDLGKARVNAGVPKSAPKPGGRKEMNAVKEARRETARLHQADNELRKDEESLQRLRDEINDAKAAHRQIQLIERAFDHAAAIELRDSRKVARAAFLDPIGSMTGFELQDVQEHQNALDELRQQRTEVERKLEETSASLVSTGFPDVIPSREIVDELRQRLAKLQELVADLARHGDAIAEIQSLLSRRRAAIGDKLTDGQLGALDADGLRRLAELTRDFVHADGEFQAKVALQEWVGTVEAPANLTELRAGVDMLYRRLQLLGQDASGPVGVAKLALLVAAGLIVIQAILLAVEVSSVYAALAILALPIVWVAFRKRVPASAATAAIFERLYSALALDQPDNWSADSILQVLTRVREQLANAETDQQKSIRWDNLADQRARVEERAQAVVAQRDSLQVDLGVTPADGDWESLRTIADHLRDWRQAADDLARSEDRATTTEDHIEEALARINETFATVACESATDVVAVGIRINTLHDRINEAKSASDRLDSLRKEIERRIDPDVEKRRTAIDTIYANLGVDSGDLLTLRDLCDQVPGCKDADQHLRDAENQVISTLGHLSEAPELVGLDRSELDASRTDAETVASHHDELLNRHTAVETRVEDAKQQTRIEDAYAREVTALETLAEAREKSYDQDASWRLAEFIHERTRDLNRPPVYREAQNLFAAFTAGAYTLEFSDDANPTFMARKTETGEVLELEKLSSGTRVQLLMAVRLAFIETLEHGFRLPLLLDETFGNTDDLRIGSIMDATIEISRRGRQIIYFTAQREEIAKWRARLSRSPESVPYKIFDLAEVRGLAAFDEAATISWETETFAALAPPEHLDHAGAKEFFRVPPIDPWRGHLDSAHAWYFFMDVPVLSTLREYGIETWGQYTTLRPRTLNALIPNLDEIDARASIRYRAIDAALEFWRVGRCRPIDRQIVAESFASGSQDAVCEIAERTGWDGASLIEALRATKVDGVTDRRIDRFELRLRSIDRITELTTHPDRVIRAHVLATMNGELTEDEIDTLLQALGEGAPRGS